MDIIESCIDCDIRITKAQEDFNSREILGFGSLLELELKGAVASDIVRYPILY